MRETISTTNALNPLLVEGILRHFQKNFPLVSKPFAYIAECLDSNEAEVLKLLSQLSQEQLLTRVGPVFDHRRAGASLLAAVSVPESEKDRIAVKINAYAEVNHNYARDHHFNLWFVVTAPDLDYLAQRLEGMEQDLGYPILRLPMLKSYHIDLGFQLHQAPEEQGFQYPERSFVLVQPVNQKILLAAFDQQYLRVLIQEGIALTERPFALLAARLSEKSGRAVSEDSVLHTLRYWQQSGLIKRFGLITNHYRMGYQSSAMVVWDIPDDQVDQVGAQFKSSGLVSLCYQRPRRLPEWPYNLFCMIHSKDRASVVGCVQQLQARFELAHIQKELLFTTRQYKQKGGVYSRAEALADANVSSVSLASSVADLACSRAASVVAWGESCNG